MVIESIQSLLPSNGLVFVFFNWKSRFRQDESETCCFEEFYVRLGTVFPSLRSLPFSEFGRFGILELPIKHALTVIVFMIIQVLTRICIPFFSISDG